MSTAQPTKLPLDLRYSRGDWITNATDKSTRATYRIFCAQPGHERLVIAEAVDLDPLNRAQTAANARIATAAPVFAATLIEVVDTLTPIYANAETAAVPLAPHQHDFRRLTDHLLSVIALSADRPPQGSSVREHSPFPWAVTIAGNPGSQRFSLHAEGKRLFEIVPVDEAPHDVTRANLALMGEAPRLWHHLFTAVSCINQLSLQTTLSAGTRAPLGASLGNLLFPLIRSGVVANCSPAPSVAPDLPSPRPQASAAVKH